MITILSNIQSPDDVKKLSPKELPILAKEIRQEIVDVVGKNGGHLASNLGVVDLTIALHRSFNSPTDALIWDVSHQCYAHKLLTGRYNQFSTLRQHGGLSGFTKKNESPHDFFDVGHSSTSISSALGLLTAWNLEKRSGKVVAIIGDGALTGGMAIEAISHAGQLSKNLIVVLNDNQMSISPNTGSLSRYLSRLTMTSSYQNFRHTVDHLVDKIPYFNKHLGRLIFRIKRGIKGLFLTNNLFVDLGFEYVGPLDGHDINELEKVFEHVKQLPRPVVVHVVTRKGKGVDFAENDPARFHAIGPFCVNDGTVEKFDTTSFTEAFSRSLMKIALTHSNIVAITAAMAKGTGLDPFASKFPDRFFDVGIAEQHAVTFASGLASGGMIPVICLYSTFMQRAVDQIIHDVALQNVHVVLMLDRAGVVPSDGETHQGLFDIPLLRSIPNLTILTASSVADLNLCLTWAVDSIKTPVVIRYPKMSCPSEVEPFFTPVQIGKGLFVSGTELLSKTESKPSFINSKKSLIICTGGMYSESADAAKILMNKNYFCDLFILRFIKPLDTVQIIDLSKNYDSIVIVEDGVKIGGIGEYIENCLLLNGITNVCVKAFPDEFLPQGTRNEVCQDSKMTGNDIADAAIKLGEKSF